MMKKRKRLKIFFSENKPHYHYHQVVLIVLSLDSLSHFILSETSDFIMNDNPSKAVHAFPIHMLIPLSADEIFHSRHMNWSTNFRDLPLKVEMAPFCLKYMNSVLSAFM